MAMFSTGIGCYR